MVPSTQQLLVEAKMARLLCPALLKLHYCAVAFEISERANPPGGPSISQPVTDVSCCSASDTANDQTSFGSVGDDDKDCCH